MTDSSVTNGAHFENGNHNRELQELLFERILQAKSVTNLIVKSKASTDDVYNSACMLDEVLQITINEVERIQSKAHITLDNS